MKEKSNKRKTTEEFINEVYDLVKDEYTVFGEYLNNKTHMKFKHNKCGFEYTAQPLKFIQGKRCPKCAGKYITNEDFLEFVKNNTDGDYLFLDEYVHTEKKLRYLHTKCGNISEVTPHHFRSSGSRCPICARTNRKSRTEKYIHKLLSERKLYFEEEKYFKGNIDKGPMYYDFYIPEYSAIIEYDGEYHYLESTSSKQEVLETKHRDNLKNKFAINNGMVVYRIPYWNKNKIKKAINAIFEDIDKSSTTIETTPLVEGSRVGSSDPKREALFFKFE